MKTKTSKKGTKKAPVKLSVRSTPVRATRFSAVVVPVAIFALALSFAASLWWSPVLVASAAVDPLYVQCHNHLNDNANPLIDLMDPSCNGAANTAPVAQDQNLSTPQNVAIGITLTAVDVDNDLLYYATTTSPTNGDLSVLVAGDTTATLSYTPHAGFSGSDSFNFSVHDGRLADLDSGTITITVNAPEAPTTHNLTIVATGPGTASPDSPNPHNEGFSVIITATPGAHAHWVSWSESACTTSGPCTVVMNTDTSVTTTFACDEGFNPPSEGVDCTAPAPPAQESSSGSGSSGGGGGGGGGGGIVSGPLSIGFVNTNPSGGQVLGASVVAGEETLPLGCSALLSDYLKEGVTNDAVKKLQIFLNKELELSIPVTGHFGPQTLEAVNAFQLKYSEQVLKPWIPFGLPNEKTPTGYVYKTTQHMINMLSCSTLNLPAPQLP